MLGENRHDGSKSEYVWLETLMDEMLFGCLLACALEDETEFFSYLERAILLRCSFVGPTLKTCCWSGRVGKGRERVIY